MKERLNALEIIDLGPEHYTQEEYNDCLHQLGRIGKYLGGNRSTLRLFNSLSRQPKSILDVGCGGGQFTMQLARAYPSATIRGIDISTQAIHYANKLLDKSSKRISNVTFSVPETPELNEPPKSFDVVTATLVCHHLSDIQLIQFLQKSVVVAKQAVIINDLHRHPFAYKAFSIIAPVFFPNRLIVHDGLLSIQRSFTRKDWIRILTQAQIPPTAYSLSWHWPFRWVLAIYPKKMKGENNARTD